MRDHSNLRCPTADHRTMALSATECGLVALVVCVLLVAAFVSTSVRPDVMRTTTVRVDSGDSLWEIAARFPVDGLTTGETVDLIVELNDLKSVQVPAGSSLRVPAGPASDAVAMR